MAHLGGDQQLAAINDEVINQGLVGSERSSSTCIHRAAGSGARGSHCGVVLELLVLVVLLCMFAEVL